MQKTPLERFERMMEEMPRRMMGKKGKMGTTAIDVAERDGEFVVTCDMPGFEKDDIDLRVTDHTLHVHAEREAAEEREGEEYLHRERMRTDVSRSIPLPEDIDEDDVSATYENGVLTVTLPKEQAEMEEQSHKISLS